MLETDRGEVNWTEVYGTARPCISFLRTYIRRGVRNADRQIMIMPNPSLQLLWCLQGEGSGIKRKTDAIRLAELSENFRQMCFDRRYRNAQCLGDLFVAGALAENT